MVDRTQLAVAVGVGLDEERPERVGLQVALPLLCDDVVRRQQLVLPISLDAWGTDTPRTR